MISELTEQQREAVTAHRDNWFSQATSTEPANRPEAGKAARILAELAGVKRDACEIHWANNPSEGDALWDSLSGSLSDSLCASLWDSLSDSGWQSFYVFCRDILGVGYDQDADAKLRGYEDLAASCFAFWLLPGHIILCERPAAVEITDGNLVGLTWKGGMTMTVDQKADLWEKFDAMCKDFVPGSAFESFINIIICALDFKRKAALWDKMQGIKNSTKEITLHCDGKNWHNFTDFWPTAADLDAMPEPKGE